MNDIVTIVTPSYNQGQFIEETINSVLSQEGDFFIQYIIADGGSTDNSVEIIKKYEKLLKEKKYPVRCKGIEYIWWSRKDRGQADAINQGFKLAKGDIIGWLNSDDVYFTKEVISEVIKCFNQLPGVDVIYGNNILINENNLIMKVHCTPKKFSYVRLLRSDFIIQPATFFQSRVIKKYELDISLSCVMDYEFWLKIGREFKFLHLDRLLACERRHGNMKTIVKDKEMKEENLRVKRKYGYFACNKCKFMTVIDKVELISLKLKGIPLILKLYTKKGENAKKFAFNARYDNVFRAIFRQIFNVKGVWY